MQSANTGHVGKAGVRILRHTLQEEARVRYREAILNAAESVILSRGYHAAKMTEIAEATGVSVGTLYNYFDSKEAVLIALAEYHQTRFVEFVSRPFNSDHPLTQIRELIARSAEFVESNGTLFSLYVQWKFGDGSLSRSMPPRVELAKEKLTEMVEELLEKARSMGCIRQDISIERMVWSLLTPLEALLWDWWHNPNSYSFAKRGQEIAALFLEGAMQTSEDAACAVTPAMPAVAVACGKESTL